MFQINLSKLSDFDTQVITLIELSPGSWRIGSAPTLICHHEQLGWFHRHWIFGVQPLINTPGSTRLRSLTWRGQILLRRKIREIKRSAIDLNVPEAIAPAPTVGRSNVPTSGTPPLSLGGMVGGASTASGVRAMQAQQGSLMRQLSQNMGMAVDSHMGDAFRFAAAASGMPAPPKPNQVIQMQTDLSQPMIAGHTRKAYLDSGCPPQVVDQAFKGDESAMCAAVDWAMQHM